MKYEEIRFAWNAQAEDGKQWNSLTEAEKVEWAARLGAEKERGPAPIFSQEARKNLERLQRNGFNVVGYALEHCNDWADNRRCTVDSKGLVRWIPSTDQEVATERAARQKAQEEVVFLKERIARAGVEHRRALHEALQQERELLAATQPAAQGLDAETQRHAAIGKAIERACMDLPDGTEISVSLEKDAGTVTLIDQDGNEHENFSTDCGFAGVLNEAIDAALAAQAKQGEK